MKYKERENRRMYLVFYLRVFGDEAFIGFVIDISTKGLMVMSESAVTPDREYNLKIKLPPDMKKKEPDRYAVFSAKCKWSQPDEENSNFFLSGFEIDNLTAHDRVLIEQTIREYRLP